MLKKLRLKFILISMVSVFFVLATTITSINISNFAIVERNAKTTLTQIVEYGAENPMPPEPRVPGDNDHPEGRFIEARYFITIFNEDGSIKEANYSRIFMLSDEECEKLSLQVYKSELRGRKYGNYRFTRVENQDKTTSVAFLDIKLDLDNAKSFLLLSSLISLGAYALLFGLIIIASKIAFKHSEEAFKKQRKFITNASHELKTPLTVISADLDLIEMDNGKSEWSESIRNQVQRLTEMTNELVDLSRLQEDISKNYPFMDFSLNEAALNTVETFKPSFEKEQISLEFKCNENIKMFGNQYLIEKLMVIFLDNSLKYTGGKEKKSVFEISKVNKNKVEIIFSNTIDKSDELDVNLLMDRFYRSPSNKKEGSGIGLSIADEIIKLHKGKIKINKNTDKIFFEISFSL